MVLIETSAWIEFLRDTGSSVCLRVDELLGENMAICEPVRMEILAGARDDKHLNDLRRLLAGATLLATQPIDYEETASLFRVCRRGGETVRKLIDCLIATIAIRADVPILHNDSDFEILGRHTALSISRPI
jgi:predicted nucleic acid-binding protein